MVSLVRLNCAAIRFGSYLDEKHLFTWAEEISCFERWDQDTLVLRAHAMSDEDLREILALFRRYQIPMQQLAMFLTDQNQRWFADPDTYWHENVFGKNKNGND